MLSPLLRAPSHLNGAAARDLAEQARAAVASGAPVVVVDLAAVESLDSTCVGALVDMGREAQAAGALVLLDKADDTAAGFFDMLHVSRALFVRRAGDPPRIVGDAGTSPDHLRLVP